MNKNEEIREHIRKSYASIALKGVATGCGCGCGSDCNDAVMDIKGNSINLGYSEDDLSNTPIEANMGLGCGNPIGIAALREGETVLDLGSGGGFDCFLARRQVGETGYVIGVDMTPEMIRLSRENAEKSGCTNVEFRLGEIEHLPVADESVDVIISNCVINLSLEKEQVFKEAYRVLKPGGRLSISDVAATAELPEDVRNDLAMMAGCIAGAEYTEDIRAMLERAGFSDIQMTPKDNSREIIGSWAPGRKIEDFVASFIIEAEKIPRIKIRSSCCSSAKLKKSL
jgi:SAM-dependent methyltransferase